MGLGPHHSFGKHFRSLQGRGGFGARPIVSAVARGEADRREARSGSRAGMGPPRVARRGCLSVRLFRDGFLEEVVSRPS